MAEAVVEIEEDGRSLVGIVVEDIVNRQLELVEQMAVYQIDLQLDMGNCKNTCIVDKERSLVVAEPVGVAEVVVIELVGQIVSLVVVYCELEVDRYFLGIEL